MRPTYRLQLSGETIDGTALACLGSQLLRILDVVRAALGNVIWYAVDVDAHQDLPDALSDTRREHPVVVGTTEKLCALAGSVDQFIAGVFLAVPASAKAPHFPADIETEDEPYRDIGDAVMEVRMFDTSYIELYARERRALADLHDIFGGTVETAVTD